MKGEKALKITKQNISVYTFPIQILPKRDKHNNTLRAISRSLSRSFIVIKITPLQMASYKSETNKIYKFITTFDIGSQSLLQLHKKFQDQTSSILPFSKFRKITKIIDLKYIRKKTTFDNSYSTLLLRRSFALNFMNFLIKRDSQCFLFDVTSISESSLNKRQWSLKTNISSFKKEITYNLTRILLAVSFKGNFFIMFSKGNVNTDLITSFLEEVKTALADTKKPLTIVLDNARCSYDESDQVICIGDKD